MKCGRVETGIGVYKLPATSAVTCKHRNTHTRTLVFRVDSTWWDTKSYQRASFLPLPLERNTNRLTDCFSLTSDFTAGLTSSRSRWNRPRSTATAGGMCVTLKHPHHVCSKTSPIRSAVICRALFSPRLSLPDDFRASVKIRSHKKRRTTSLGSGYCKCLPGEWN